MALEKWSTTAGSNVNANTGINWDEGMAPSAVNDSARSTMADLRDWYDNAEWPIYGRNGSANSYSISFVSTTVFKFAGTDRRTLVPINRRVKAGVGAGVIYGTCTDVTLSASDTQATVAWDSGQLDSSLSYIALGVLNSSNNSFPRNLNMSFSDLSVAGAIRGSPDASLSDVVFTGNLSGTGVLTLASTVSASGTSVSILSGLPTTVKRVTINFQAVSTNGTNGYLIQIGPSGGVETTGYTCVSNATASTAGFLVSSGSASNTVYGSLILTLMDSATNTWTCTGVLHTQLGPASFTISGVKPLAGVLNKVSATTVGGTDSYDLGVFSGIYE